jgi:hypothetical protein
VKTIILAFIVLITALAAPRTFAAEGGSPADAAPLPAVSAGRLERFAVDGAIHVPGREIDVWLPPGYPDAAPYAVAVMFDGQMLFDASINWNRQEWRADETAASVQAAGRTRPFVIVAVPNAGAARRAEYFPQKPFESLPSEPRDALFRAERDEALLFARAPYSDAFLAWLDEAVLPAVESRFAVSNDADDRVLIGASMGGLISVYGVLERPSRYGGFGALSTHWPGVMPDAGRVTALVPPAFFAYLRDRLPAPGTHRLYFDHGDATLDAFYPPLQAEADRIAVSKGWAFPAYRSLAFPGAEHSENAWAARLDGVFAFLLPPRAD